MGEMYNVTSFVITFEGREENVPPMVVDIDFTGNSSTTASHHADISTQNWEEGDKVLVFTDEDAGSDTAKAERQRYTISQAEIKAEKQLVSIRADAETFEEQIISLYSETPISGGISITL